MISDNTFEIRSGDYPISYFHLFSFEISLIPGIYCIYLG